jgi:hypothetical protein
MVLPVPGIPQTRMQEDSGKPPSINLSKPSIPELTRDIAITFF